MLPWQVRERIETSGRDARWEFNKATLFSCSNYMAEVCGNLMEMVEVVDDFFKFLGPELKAVTGKYVVCVCLRVCGEGGGGGLAAQALKQSRQDCCAFFSLGSITCTSQFRQHTSQPEGSGE